MESACDLLMAPTTPTHLAMLGTPPRRHLNFLHEVCKNVAGGGRWGLCAGVTIEAMKGQTMKRHHLFTTTFVVLVLVLGAAACSDDDGGSTDGAASDASLPDGEAGADRSDETGEDEAAAGGAEDLRDERYCEVIPITREGTTLTSHVYNTQGHNDCPTDLWDALDAEQIAAEYGALMADLNGPRHWTMDAIQASGASTTGEVYDFGGIEMELRATIETDLADGEPGSEPYGVNEIQRDTVYRFDADQPIFELTSPEGDVYVMQSYSQRVDADLTYEDLEALGDRLALPEGWSYSSRVLDEELLVASGGLAYLVQDELNNSYQRRT